MRCRDLSLVIVSEPGVPGGFSASLEWGRAGQGSFPNPLPETCPVTWVVSHPSAAV